MDTLDHRLRQLDTLIEVTRLINSTLDPLLVRQKSIEAATRLLDAEAASLLLLDPDSDDLFFDVAVGEKGSRVKSIRLPRGAGIGGWVIDHDTPQIVTDVGSDARFFATVDKRSGFVTRDLICVPVKARGRILGALEGINKRAGTFDDDDLLALYGLANQVAMAIENARLYQASITDGLTGLFQRRYFDLRLDDEVARINRFGYPLTVILADIDHFKRVNDRYGHVTGDTVLKNVARVLQENVRLGDVVARFGGEEFAMILPHIDERGALQVAERLRGLVAARAVAGVDVTASFGIAHFDGSRSEISPERFVERADRALYTAKANGRDRVERLAA